jgi:hypothetical protein
VTAAAAAASDPRNTGSQPPLFGAELASGRGPARRVESAVTAAVQEGIRQGIVTTLDGGLAALAVECGRAVDVASGRHDPYGVAAAAQRLAEALTRLRLDPSAREAGRPDGVSQLLAQLAQPSLGDAAQS